MKKMNLGSDLTGDQLRVAFLTWGWEETENGRRRGAGELGGGVSPAAGGGRWSLWGSGRQSDSPSGCQGPSSLWDS